MKIKLKISITKRKQIFLVFSAHRYSVVKLILILVPKFLTWYNLNIILDVQVINMLIFIIKKT